MPISSTEVSNIIQSQVGMFSASAAYAHAVSAQYGYQSTGGMGVNDPRQTSYMAQQGLHAGNVGGMMARAPGMAAGGLGTMAMFGFGPRALDPFTMSMQAASQGFARQGMAGAVGMGGASMLGYGALGAAGSWATNQMVGGAQNRGMLNAQMGQAFPGMGSQGLGMMSQQVEAQARSGMGNLREITSVMQQGVSSGAVDTTTLTQFSQSFSKLMNNVRQVATVMNTSLQQAQQAMQSVSGMGVSGDQAAGFLGTMKGIGQAAHISPAGMMGVAQAGAKFGQAAGIDMTQAATGAMVSAGVYGYTERNKLISGITGEAQGRYTGAATRFLGTKQGRTLLGAIMTPQGEFDTESAGRIAGGAMNWKDIQGAYKQNITGSSQRDMLTARGGEIAGQFISEFGPQAVAPAVKSLTDTSDTPETLSRTLTGLNRNDQRAMEMLASNTGQLREKMISEARAGFQEGQGKVGISQIMSKAIDELTKPVKAQFQKLGASMTQYYQDAVQDVSQQVTGTRGGGFSAAQAQDWGSQLSSITQSGNTQALGNWNQRLAGAGGGGEMGWGNRGSARGWAGQAFRDFAPTGLQMGSGQMGTTFGELPGFGFGLEDYQPGQTSLAVGSAARVFPGGRNVIGAAGQALGGAGALITGRGGANPVTGLFGGRGSGFMDLGGHGMVGGTARLGGGAMRLGGAALRAGGALTGALGMGIMGYEMATNAGPEASRLYGMTGISQGAITGNNSQLLQALGSMGALPEDAFSRKSVGMAVGGLDAEGAAAQSLTPISGTFEQGSGYYGGTQNFLTEKGTKAVDKLITGMGGDQTSLLESLGGQAHVNSVIDLIKSKTLSDGYSDFEAVEDFMTGTGATSDQAYMILGSRKDKGESLFQGKLKTKFERSRQFEGNPTKAREETVRELNRSVGNHLAAVLGGGGEDAKAKADILLSRESGKARELLGETLGIGEDDLKSKLEDVAGGGKFSDKPADSPFKGRRGGSAKAAESATMTAMMLSGDNADAYESIVGRYRGLAERGGGSTSDLAARMNKELMGAGIGWGEGLSGLDIKAKAHSEQVLTGMSGSTGEQVGQTPGRTAIQAEVIPNYVTGRASKLEGQRGRALSGGRYAAAAGGYANLNQFQGAVNKFSRGIGTVEDDGTVQMKNFENEAMQDVARMFLSDDMTSEGRDRAISSFEKGGSDFEGRAATVGANVRYYTKQWENSKGSPVKFLANITHDPAFNKLTTREKNFLRGTDDTGLTTNLQSLLIESSRDIHRSSGKKPTDAEVEGLADDLVRGARNEGSGDRDTLTAHLSTNYNPVRPDVARGGAGAGADRAVAGVVSALEGLTSKLEGWFPPNASYGG